LFLHGKLTITDTLDLIQNFIIIGNEELTITFHTTDSDSSISLYFRIYKIERDKTNQRGDVKQKMLELYFCSAENITSNLTTISKKFEDNPETIVQTLLTTYLSSSKTLTSDSTSSPITVYSNFWKFPRVVDFIARNSKSSSYSDYIFYENFDGFNFVSISSLLAQDPMHDIEFRTNTESFIGNKNIKIYKFDEYFDINEMSRVNLFGTTFYKPDEINYAYTKTEQTLSDNYEVITTNGLSKQFNDNLSTASNIVSTNFYDPDVSKVRLASLKLLQNYNFVVQLNGDFGRKCGNNLNMNFPNLDNESNINEAFNGNWMILAVKHMISQKNIYTQNLSLCKNAFFRNNDLPTINSLLNI
jgi:hypothetical protein